MAKATKEVKQITVTKIEEQEIITLELFKAEAEFLLFILENVSGSPYNSPRKIADDIAGVLREEDINYTKNLEGSLAAKVSIHFKEFI